ncbi:unnamed protein product [Schistosoma curassoni]|uniref:40S ribosomal protein S15 n=1 Tax=Schistosoma curassoni TaxID=6186 RepID=A0A183JK04_9TREM|nr:unnamed protein product [Schistosoma curassoni]
MRERFSTEDSNNSSTEFGCSVHELQGLMQLRGAEAVEVVNKRFGGASGLCKRLKTSPTQESEILLAEGLPQLYVLFPFLTKPTKRDSL